MITAEITRIITGALKELGIKRPQVTLEHPTEMTHGDYATNVALVYAKKLNLSPLEVARTIVAAFNREKITGLERVEIAGFGFINFYLSPSFFAEEVGKIISAGEQYGTNDALKNQKVIIEYTDPNPFKEFHIGHLMSNVIGESLARLFEGQGADLRRACYQGDVGLHIAKAVYGLQAKKFDFWKLKLWGNAVTRARFLGQAYAFGAKAYDIDPTVQEAITKLNKEIYLRTSSVTNYYYDIGKEWSLNYFDSIYKVVGTKFDFFFFESGVADFGLETVKKFKDQGIFKESDGAVVFPGEEYGLHTRVFINSKGLPTYEAKELALAQIKYDEYSYDKSIVITGNEINDYFKVILKAMEFVFPQLVTKTTHISHGMLRLPSGKMSSRTGDVITAVSVIDDVKALVKEKIKDNSLTQSTKEVIAQAVAVGAIKFSILRQAPGRDIVFDFDKSLSFEGDSGPYLQYSYTRAKSVLEKADSLNLKADVGGARGEEITLLEKLIYRFPEVVERAGQEYAPHLVVTYLLDLASSFNSFYAGTKIVDPDDVQSPYRLALTESFATVMKNGLYLLGIEAPDKM